MSTAYRQCLLLRMIPRHPRRIDTSTIEEKLREQGYNIHKRTIQRDLETFSELFPLICDTRERPYGWSWSPDADLFDIPQMDPATAITFRMVDEFLSSVMPPAVLHMLQPHFSQAERVLDDIKTRNMLDWPDKIRILSRSQPLSPPYIEPAVLDVVYDCLLEEKKFFAVYHRRGETETVEYTVNPLGVVLLDNIIYLVCTMKDYNQHKDIRQLAVHRIVNAQKLDEAGIVPEDFSLQNYIDSGAFSYLRGENRIRLKALFEKDAAIHLAETPLGTDQIITEKDSGMVQVESTVLDTAQLRWWLLGFGGRVEVLEPEFLRDEFRKHAERMAEIYL